MLLRLLLLGAAAVSCAAPAPPPRAILLLSIDGLRPDYATDPAYARLKIPNLRRLIAEGASASGARGVLPTVTYPSHTSLITGAAPARHGIVQNKPFDPAFKNGNAWYWFAEDIRVPTVWDVAARAGYTVGSVSWPVSVGARAIRYNLPEFAGTLTPDDLKMIRALAGPDVFASLEKAAGPYLVDVNQAVPRDWARTRYSVELIRRHGVRFLTVHLAALDHTQHESGPFTAHAFEVLEAIDRMFGELRDAMLAADPAAAICVVSDHGFAKVDHVLKLDAAFVKAGLITLRSDRESLATAGVAEWKAMPWLASGSAAIRLREPKDAATRARVAALLKQLAADPANGIAAVLDEPEIARQGGAPQAAFWVDLQPGFSVSASLAGPIAAPVPTRGTHGYAPSHSELNAFFAIAGKGLRRGARLGEIDLRSIAPTLARLMGASLPTAEAPALAIETGGSGRNLP
jgi:predicted AlkP superfamily pyrophosphatase or phosphodiesterase